MKYSFKKIAVFSLISFASYLSLNYSSSPAGSQGLRATGASFDGQNCSGCHSGGTYTTSATMALYHGTTATGTPVTTYNYGGTYTLRITRTITSGTPAGFGFQMTCATTTGNTNVNKWGTSLPTNTANHTSSSRNYIEHTSMISNSTLTLDFPWTGPVSGTGNVTFYLSLNNVNGTGGTGGDKVNTITLPITISGLPVTWLYFNGTNNNNQNQLQWAASYERDCKYYTIEKSADGNDFSELTKVTCKNNQDGTSIYDVTDTNPFATTYYRVKQTDINGDENYFKTIMVKKNSDTKNCSYFYNGEVVVNLERDNAELVTASLYAIDGRLITSFPVYLNSGMNRITYPKPEQTGLYFIHITNANGNLYDQKILVP